MKTALAKASARRRWQKPIRTICVANSSRRISREKEAWRCWRSVSTSAWVGPGRCRRRIDAAAVGRARRHAREDRAANLRGDPSAGGRMDGRTARSDVARTAVAAARGVATQSEYRSVVESVAGDGAAPDKNALRRRAALSATLLARLQPHRSMLGQVKQQLRSAKARSLAALETCLADALAAVTPHHMQACFRHCGHEL